MKLFENYKAIISQIFKTLAKTLITAPERAVRYGRVYKNLLSGKTNLLGFTLAEN